MDEYISREAVLEKVKSSISVPTDNEWDCGYNTAMAEMLEFIKQTPSTDLQPVKHGYWEEVIDYGGWGDTHYRCSVCGEEWYLEDGKPKDNEMNFCPRCGARMDGDAK